MTAVWARCERVLWRRVTGGTLLLAPTEEDPFVVTGPGASVWELLAEPRDLPSMAKALSSDYGISPEQVAGDITPFLEALVERAVVSVSSGGS